MTEELLALKRQPDALLTELRNAGAIIEDREGRRIRCPYHGSPVEKTASAGIYQTPSGTWSFKCQACGAGGSIVDVMAKNQKTTPEEILKQIGGPRDWKPLSAKTRTVSSPVSLPAAPPPKKPNIFATRDKLAEAIEWSDKESGGKIVKTYEYVNPENGKIDLIVFRLQRPDGDKSFRQASPIDGGFVMKAPEGKLPIYNRTRISKSKKVIVAEGEKCVEILAGIGVVATTNPGGAGKAALADWTPLEGKEVWLWPDNDPTGIGVKHMRAVETELLKLKNPPLIRWIEPETLELPAKGDVEQYLAKLPADATESDKSLAIEGVMEFAEYTGTAGELFGILDEACAGKRRAAPFPGWPMLFAETKALRPGALMVLCGDPGATKSFWSIEAFCNWFLEKTKVAILMLEDTRGDHARRALAQKIGDWRINDDEECEKNAAWVKETQSKEAEFIAAFGGSIQSYPTGEITTEEVLRWIEERAASGCRVIGVDPVTAMDGGSRQWVSDLKFVIKAKQIISKYGASLILVMHPRKGKDKIQLDDLAGGAAYSRFAHTVLWLEWLENKVGPFMTPFGPAESEYNRLMHILKARNGGGKGKQIGFYFDPKTFRSREVGVKQKNVSKAEPLPDIDGGEDYDQ